MIIEKNVSLSDKNWFRTGGCARYFARPKTIEEFKEALFFAENNNLKVVVLGLGANVLISDDGIDGLVIRPELRNIELVDETVKYGLVRAGAGVTMHQLIEWCLDHNLVGLEEFSAIPGTVGGSIYNNLHYFDFSLSDFVVSGEVMHRDTGQIKIVDKEWFSFEYDKSTLHNHNYFLINATFRVNKVDDLAIVFARGRRAEITRHRIKRYPMAYTCGCFFKNFNSDEVDLEINGRRAIWIAYYFDKLGYKGTLRVGDAVVSPQHSNMIVHTGKATTLDIVELAYNMQEGVKKSFGIVAKPECHLLGFKTSPLL